MNTVPRCARCAHATLLEDLAEVIGRIDTLGSGYAELANDTERAVYARAAIDLAFVWNDTKRILDRVLAAEAKDTPDWPVQP
jgi:hypothetical protein